MLWMRLGIWMVAASLTACTAADPPPDRGDEDTSLDATAPDGDAGEMGDVGPLGVDSGPMETDSSTSPPEDVEPGEPPASPAIQALFANCSEPGGERNIYDLQDPQCPDHITWSIGQSSVPVTLTGVVATGVFGDTLFVQEEKGGAYSGISVYTHGLPTSSIQLGDRLEVVGSYSEFYELSQLFLDEWSVLSSGDPLWPWTPPDPALLAQGQTAEMLEGVLVRVLDVETTHTWPDCPHDYGEFEVTGGLRIDDMGVHWTAHLGDQFGSIVGPLHYTFGNYKLEPRDMDDIEVTTEGNATALSKCFAEECQAPEGDLGTQAVTITEILVDPYGPDPGQEWIELYNPSQQDVSLDGWEIRDCGEQVIQLLGPGATIPAEGFLVLGMNENGATNGGAPVDYAYGDGFYLPNTVGSVLLYDGQEWQGELVDQVRYSRFDPWDQLQGGRSLERVSPLAPGESPDSWQAGEGTYGDSDNQGTPGAPNAAW